MGKDFLTDDADLTQIFPMPGGNKWDIEKQLRDEQKKRLETKPSDPTQQVSSFKHPFESGKNLLDASSNLLVLIAHLSNSIEAHNPDELKDRVTREVNQYIATLKRLNIDDRTVSESTYILCTAVDEAVLNTPWGKRSRWSVNTLLSSFFQDVSGGQVFFEKMRLYAEDPVKNYQILKLMYFCLALGYQGRYRTEEDAQGKLNQVRQWLVEKLRHSNADATQDLSPHWIGITGLTFSLKNFFSMWTIIGIGSLLLALIFSFFLMQLNIASGKVGKALDQIKIPVVERPKPEKIYIPPTPEEPTIAEQLNQSNFTVHESANKTTVLIPGDILFASGSVLVSDKLVVELNNLAKVLKSRDGHIRITGHSDNVPLSFSLKQRFGSNKGLSLQRAKSVANIVNQVLQDDQRIETYGKGDKQPLADNNAKEGRAKNRRVEIEILH